MKKILLFSSLSLLLFLPGCGGGSGGGGAGFAMCTFQGTPGVPYIVYYPITADPVRGTVPSNGIVTVLAQGFPCSSLTIVFGSNMGNALAASPSSVYLPSPPSSGTITGQGFDGTYGMPKVEYFESSGFLIGSVYATSVSGSTSLQANLPDLSNVWSGTYQVRVTNKRSDGNYLNIVGSATMTAWGRDRTDTDGDGWWDDQDCDPYDPYLNASCGETCGGGQQPITVCEY